MTVPWLIAFVVQWLLTLFILLLVFGILRYLASVKERWESAIPKVSGYELGQRITDIELMDINDTPFRLLELTRRLNGAILLFVSSNCESCTTLLNQITELLNRSETRPEKTFILIVTGPSKNLQHFLETHPGLENERVILLSDEKSVALSQFGILSIPTAFILNKEGEVIDQTFNPHATNWIYKASNTTPPQEPIAKGRIAIFAPVNYKIK